ncbi:UreD urease accessory protein [Glomus cerebriforme]|uniref:UreD urease accessory protein n=1 Tax=Glomus cerebriforme TaxID=658196 RepID=A0A397T483_9GLOM|nr:UreD urease accessory protein [Glomus cerebriforme]
MTNLTTNSKPPPGHGQIVCHVSSSTTRPSFSTFRASYPIKLLTPKVHSPYLAAAYIITYGGGMVSGDSVSLSVETHPNVNLMLLTQGSTKIYKQRPGKMFVNNNISHNGEEESKSSEGTRQKLNAFIDKNSLLLQLPEPTTCFRDADFTQRQSFTLQDITSSIIILDWFTCGRMSRGERWDFFKYDSGIDLILGDKLIFRDVVLLKNDKQNNNILKERLEPYECYATLVLYGPKIIPLIHFIIEEFNKIVIGKLNKMPELVWSASILSEKQDVIKGVVVKIAGVTTEVVRNFLINVALKDLEDIIGENLFKRAL